MPRFRFNRRRRKGTIGFSSFAGGNTRVRTRAYRPTRRFRFGRRRRPMSRLWKMARKAYRFTRIHRPEMRLLDLGNTEVNPVPLAGSWHSANIFAVGQGTANNQRIGQTLFASMIQLYFWVKLLDPATPPTTGWEAHYRILVIQWYDNQESGIVNNVDVFDNTAAATPGEGNISNIMATYRPMKIAQPGEQRDRKFRVLYDKTQQLYQFPGAVKNEEIFTVTIKPRTIIRFTSTTNALDNIENPIGLFIFATQNAGTAGSPSIQLSHRRRMWFTAR